MGEIDIAARREPRAALARLAEHPRFGVGVGLHRMRWAVERLPGGDWLAGFDALRVTGSTGKGSVAAMADAILGALGVSRGRYLSPHFHHLGERIAVGGEEITEAELDRAAAWFEGVEAELLAAHPEDGFGAFEALTAAALHHFARRRPETVVAEVGIGGRFDPTRVLPGRTVALTAVSLEHTALLGPTRELIAYDKAELAPEGGTLVVGRVGAELLRRLEGFCAVRGVRLVDAGGAGEGGRLGRVEAEGVRTVADLELPGLSLPRLEIALAGRHQAANALVAVALVQRWTAVHRPRLPAAELAAAVRRGLAEVRLAGRFERLRQAPDVWVDVGHTPESAAALAEAAGEVFGRAGAVLLVGVSAEREPGPLLAPLLPLAVSVVATRAHHRGGAAAVVERAVRHLAPALPVVAAEPLEEGVAEALAQARERGRPLLVAGGFFVAAEAARVLSGEDPHGVWSF